MCQVSYMCKPASRDASNRKPSEQRSDSARVGVAAPAHALECQPLPSASMSLSAQAAQAQPERVEQANALRDLDDNVRKLCASKHLVGRRWGEEFQAAAKAIKSGELHALRFELPLALFVAAQEVLRTSAPEDWKVPVGLCIDAFAQLGIIQPPIPSSDGH